MRRTRNNAHLFINYLLRPEVAAQNSNLVKYANGDTPTLRAARRGGAERPEHLSAAGGAGEARCRSRRGRRTITRLLTRTWTRFKTGK